MPLISLVFFPNPHHPDPKFLFHVKATCAHCNRFIQFLPQTEELMQAITQESKAFPFFKP